MTNSAPTFGAIGPSHTDPRSGEILDADIALESLSSRSLRTLRSQVLSSTGLDPLIGGIETTAQEREMILSGRVCTFAEVAGEQMSYRRVREARGELDRGPRGRLRHAYRRTFTMHEVGTRSPSHNFRCRGLPQAQLADPASRRRTASRLVIDYAPSTCTGRRSRAAPGMPS